MKIIKALTIFLYLCPGTILCEQLTLPIKNSNWFEVPYNMKTNAQASSLNILNKKKAATLKFPESKESLIQWEHQGAAAKPIIVTYSIFPWSEGVFEKRPRGEFHNWEVAEKLDPGSTLNKIEYITEKNTQYRIRFIKKKPVKTKLWNIGFYHPQNKGINDYWLFLGASITNQSMRQACFAPTVKNQFKQANPIIFNRGVKGWSAEDLLANLPSILENHPYASLVAIHIGGNNISTVRPYPGEEAKLKNTLEQILEMVQKGGKAPLLARPSFRLYNTFPKVPPEQYGSGPYAKYVYDPLIKKYSPDFFDFKVGHGVLDFYGYIKKNRKLLSDDGIHMNIQGENKWCEYWAKTAGKVVYASQPIAQYIGPKNLFPALDGRSVIYFDFNHLASADSHSRIIIINHKKEKLVELKNLHKYPMNRIEWNFSELGIAQKNISILQYDIRLGKNGYQGKIILN